MYSGFDPNTPSFSFFNSQCYCRPYFVIPFNVIAVHIIYIIKKKHTFFVCQSVIILYLRVKAVVRKRLQLDFRYLNRIYFLNSSFKNDFETAKPLRVEGRRAKPSNAKRLS